MSPVFEAATRYSVFEPAQHSLYECNTAVDFCKAFEDATGCSVRNVADELIAPMAAKAVFLVGSVPLGMATAGSDIDFIVMVEDADALLPQKGGGIVNSEQRFAFKNEGNALVAGAFVTLMNGVAVELQIVLAPAIGQIRRRLRARGPELSECEIMILGRLSTGWLLWQTEGLLERNSIELQDPALEVYCSTKTFVSAEIFVRKAGKVLDRGDILLAMHLGRSSVEMAYLAYFASEGYCYLGAKWLAQIGQARGAAERVSRLPMLRENLPLLFPKYASTREKAATYLVDVATFLRAMRDAIERRTLFRIAFHACPQIHDIARSRAADVVG